MPPSPHTGYLRGGLVGVLVGALAVAAHGSAGGGFPGSAELTLVLLVAALAGGAANVLAGGRGSVLGLLLLGQLASHVVLAGLAGHEHPAAATNPLPTGWMLVAHALAALGCAAIISITERLYALASGAVRAVLAEPHRPRIAGPAHWSDPGLPHYHCPPKGAIGPRAPPVPA
ncbi:hypothetical protein ACFYO1_41620 [Nocardia sp. NPDC006044]|uniref:hypothetical protein n=1 Tax=Nocardia sp. NPDC006044 TaxID=3364306 RepID=UPI00369D953E